MNRKKEIIKAIEKIAGKYSAYEVFTDWIRCCSLAVSNSCQLIQDKVWKDREQMYLDTIRKYTAEEGWMFVEMFHMLAETLESDISDVLGEIYMEAGMGSKAAGQFFTPFHLSLACAELALPEEEQEIYTINEPSCGGGGMIIAAAVALKKRGIDYQRKMKVIAQDLDWKGVYMCYLQLSLLGIDAIVVQGNTLQEPYIDRYPSERRLHTPMNRGVLI